MPPGDHFVVDQSRGADPRGDHRQHFAVDPLHRRQRVWGNELEVLGLDLGEVSSASAGPDRRGIALAGVDRGLDRLQRAVKRGRAGSRSGDSSTLRLDIASPSGSRTVGQTSIRTGMSRSRTRRLITIACWASFWPKYATSGPTMFSSLVTTVVTPSKCARPRWAPSSVSVSPATETVVANPGG